MHVSSPRALAGGEWSASRSNTGCGRPEPGGVSLAVTTRVLRLRECSVPKLKHLPVTYSQVITTAVINHFILRTHIPSMLQKNVFNIKKIIDFININNVIIYSFLNEPTVIFCIEYFQ
jgi:hypothetical protein